MSVAERWNPSTWGKPGKVVICTRPGGALDPTTAQALKEGGVEPVITSLRGPDGKVPDEVANADMVVLQGPGGNGDAFEAMRRGPLPFRPHGRHHDLHRGAAHQDGVVLPQPPPTL